MCEKKTQNIILLAFVSSCVVSCVERGMCFLSCYITSMQDAFYMHIVWPLQCGSGLQDITQHASHR